MRIIRINLSSFFDIPVQRSILRRAFSEWRLKITCLFVDHLFQNLTELLPVDVGIEPEFHVMGTDGGFQSIVQCLECTGTGDACDFKACVNGKTVDP